MIRFEEQFHCETKKKGGSALFAEKQRRNSLQSPPQEVYEVKIFCLEHLETKTVSWQLGLRAGRVQSCVTKKGKVLPGTNYTLA